MNELERYDLIIFDADGTLRDSVSGKYPYPFDSTDWELLPKVKSKIGEIEWRHHRDHGIGYGVVSNQPGIALYHLSNTMVSMLLCDMFVKAFGFQPIPELIKYCPHDRSGACACRKPHPKLILDLIRFWDVDPKKTVYVGDRDTDQQTAVNAGCEFIHRDAFFAG